MNWFSRFISPSIPDKYADYADACKNANLKKQPLSQARFVVLDTETTGLNPKTNQVLSIGAIAVRNYSLLAADAFEANLQQAHFNNESIAIHEITPGLAAQEAPAKEVLHAFLGFIGGAILIGHYIDFDYRILSESCMRELGVPLLNKRYDTMQLLKRTDTHFAHTSLHKPGEMDLDALCTRYNIPITDRHTAMGDALATAVLFARQLKKLEHRGVKTVGDLLKR